MTEKSAAWGREIARLAADQHGVVTTVQLKTAGLTKDAILTRESLGLLHRVHQSVYAVGYPRLSQHGRWMAAVLACRGHEGNATAAAYLSHMSAAALLGLLTPHAGPVDVAIIGEHGRAKRAGIRVHRPRTLEESMTTVVERIPVTDPTRTLSDLRRAKRARGGGTPQEVLRAARQASVLGMSVAPSMNRDPTRSELERHFLRLCAQNDLPLPAVNSVVAGLEVDFLWSRRHVVVETDGYRFHRGEAAFTEDRRRDLKLRAAGLQVIRLSYRQVMHESDAVATVLRQVLESAAI